MAYVKVDPNGHLAQRCPARRNKRMNYHTWAGSRAGGTSNFWSHCLSCGLERYDGFKYPYLFDTVNTDFEVVTLLDLPEPG